MNLKTGYKELDDVIGGLKEKEFIALASRPGVGKSTLAINMINHISKQTKEKILYFNLETSKEQLKKRITSDNVEIIDTPNITANEIKRKCEEVSKTGLALVVIDYIQLIRPSTFHVDVLKDVEHISKTLKSIALKLNIPVFVLSQLSKHQVKSENEDYLSHLDLQESSPLLENTDKIIFLVRESCFNQNLNTLSGNREKKVIIHTLENDIYVVIP